MVDLGEKSANAQVQFEGGIALNPQKPIGTFPGFLGFDPKSRDRAKNYDGGRLKLVTSLNH